MKKPINEKTNNEKIEVEIALKWIEEKVDIEKISEIVGLSIDFIKRH